jgi:hypothetical protein
MIFKEISNKLPPDWAQLEASKFQFRDPQCEERHEDAMKPRMSKPF